VFRVVGKRKTETTQENIHDWLELGEGDPGVSASDRGINFYIDIFFIYFHQYHVYY
jgi:hypothetical protein